MADALFTAQSGDGQGAVVSVPAWVKSVTIDVGGTWGGGTVTAQIQPPGHDGWVSQGETWTADDSKIFTRNGPYDLRLDLAGSTSPDLDAFVEFNK